jgi:hypothetical protein
MWKLQKVIVQMQLFQDTKFVKAATLDPTQTIVIQDYPFNPVFMSEQKFVFFNTFNGVSIEI